MSEHNQKHLTLSNRTYIEQELLQKNTFSSIGDVLHKNPSTISKEVKRYYKTVPAKYSYKCNLCPIATKYLPQHLMPGCIYQI